jgi:hypothetical protein
MSRERAGTLAAKQPVGWRWFPEHGIARTLMELLIVVPAYALYQFVRGLVDSDTASAFHRAATLVHVERALGIFWEAELQSLILTREVFVNLANTVYVWGHLPLIIMVAVWLYTCHRERYPLFRNAFLISGGIALIAFALAPTAPPRMLPHWGFVDTTVGDGSYYIFQPPALVNQYAAMPSMHFGWDLLAAVAIFTNLRTPWRYAALVMPAFTLFGVVFTANHFFLDAVAGAATGLFALWIAGQLRQRLPDYKPFSVLA